MTDPRKGLAAPADIAAIATFRIAFGLLVLASVTRTLVNGWVEEFFVGPRVLLPYLGFEWLPRLSPSGMYTLHGALVVLALAVAAGLLYRAAIVLLTAGFLYLQLLDVTTYLNHYVLVVLLGGILCLVPAHRAFSVDAWLRPRLQASTLPVFWTWLLRFQVGVVYFNAGLAKANADWLLHGQPLGIWLSARTDLPLVGPLLALPWMPLAMSWAGFLFDTTIVFFLLARRTRPLAYAAVIAFHALTSMLFPIGMFPVIMVVSALVFFAPDWPRRFLPRSSPAATVPDARLPRAWVAAAAVFCAVQLLWPLRAHAYGGNVSWHEQGMRFSWRVMVREKNGSLTYRVRAPGSGREWHVSPHRYLTDRQAREMSTQPDLILRLSHLVARDFERRGLGPVEVRADALVSLNGRPMQRLVDPAVDLARVDDGFDRAGWILPAPVGPPLVAGGAR